MKRLGKFCAATAVAALLVVTVGAPAAPAEEPVAVPDVVYDTLPEARQALEDRGLSLFQLVPTVDPYCNNLGDVLVQNPAAGTSVSPGTLVRISLGVASPAAGCPARQKLLVFNLGWPEGDGVRGTPLVPTQPILKFLHGPVDRWFNEASNGRFPGFEFHDAGSYMVEAPNYDASGKCEEDYLGDVRARARNVAFKHGIDLTKFDGMFIYVRDNVCANILGSEKEGAGVYLEGEGQGGIPTATIHELGHWLGLAHGGSMVCLNSAGLQVSLSEKCDYVATEHFSAMGEGFAPTTGAADIFTAQHLHQLGWLDGRFATVQAQDSVFLRETLRPLADLAGGLHAVKLVDGPTTLWIEYRRPGVGLDTYGYGGREAGVLAYLEKTVGTASALQVDLRPPLDGVQNLPVGQTWANPLGTMKITLDSVDAEGAHLTVSSQLVTVPDVRNRSLQQARSAIEGAGLAWGGTKSLLTTNCDLIGSIVGSEPSGNTRQPAGTLVTVSVAELDPRKRCK